jgi:hypothetical protein
MKMARLELPTGCVDPPALENYMEENPALYDVAREVCHEFGLPWTDPELALPTLPREVRKNMEIELLHIHHGDKRRKIDTTQSAGRNEVEKLLKNLCQQKCAIFLERGKKSYRVTGYDPVKDELIVQTGGKGKRKKSDQFKIGTHKATCQVSARDAKVAAVAPVAGGLLTMEERVRAQKVKLLVIVFAVLVLVIRHWWR